LRWCYTDGTKYDYYPESEALIGGAEAAKSSNEKLIISNAYDNEFYTVNGESASSNVFWNFNKKTGNQGAPGNYTVNVFFSA
jgi:hypothetical protein